MFRSDWPAGHDAHFFSNVFHDWDVEQCRVLAERSFAALPPGGRILLHESLLNETLDGPALVALYSMNMNGLFLSGLTYQVITKRFVVAWDTAAIVAVYVAAVGLAYVLRG